MLSFQCAACGSRVFFEDEVCGACGRAIGFDPQAFAMRTVEAALATDAEKCANWLEHSACNWLVRSGRGPHCAACALNAGLPDLAAPGNRTLWVAAERAKRRLVFSLLRLRLPIEQQPGKSALRFRLVADAQAAA